MWGRLIDWLRGSDAVLRICGHLITSRMDENDPPTRP
jgi:hypothetical protein